MKSIFSLTFVLISFSLSFSQNIVLNESTKKYEMSFDVILNTDNQNDNFDIIEEWLAVNYTNKYSNSKLSNKEKGKIIYSAAFETKIFPTKGLISFNYNIKVDKSKISFFVSDFAYTMIGQSTAAGVAMNFESKNLAGKKKIILETETKILESTKKITQ
jgi:hypothetical protein